MTGALGLLWIVPWLIFYRSSAPAPVTPARVPSPRSRIGRGRDVFFCREGLLLLGARVPTDPFWHFVLFWFPQYLTDMHKMPLPELGKIAQDKIRAFQCQCRRDRRITV